MSLKPPSLWIEQRGHQHRVYWRNAVADSPARSYLPFYGRVEAEQFIGMAGLLGLDTARQVLATDDPQEATALLQAAWAERGLAPADPMSQSAPELPPAGPGNPALLSAPADPRLTGVTFEELWARFLTKKRHIDEGTLDLYRSYGKYHLLPFFGSTDIGQILRTRPLRAADAVAGALYVDDDWMPYMAAKNRLNNVGRPMQDQPLSAKYVQNVLVVLAQCFDLAVTARPALLEINPAKEIRTAKQHRKDMHFLDDAAAYATLRAKMHPHFQPLLDFLVGTGARYGEAAGLWVQHLKLDAARPYVDIRAALKWRKRKWTRGRPKTRSSIRRILLSPRLVEVLRPLVAGKNADDYVFTMVEGKPLHHGNFRNRYWQPAVQAAAGPAVPRSIRIHDLRHTHASWLLSDGVAAVVVAARLGHSSTTTTQDVYGHVTVEADDRAVDAMNNRLPELVVRDDERGAIRLKLTAADRALEELDIDDNDDLAA